MRLREIEKDEAPRAMAYMQQLRARPPVSLRVQSAQALANRDFKVLSSLTTSTYSTVTARLVYTGTNILLYVDNQPTASTTFTDAEYENFGRQFDQDLYPIDISAFGSVSDIDANGKTFVLFTPLVNRLTLNSGQCGSYVAGFFNGADLSGNTNANRGEIFYSSVPGEPAGGATCTALGLDIVRRSAPATFIHELQHMISYNQHVLQRQLDHGVGVAERRSEPHGRGTRRQAVRDTLSRARTCHRARCRRGVRAPRRSSPIRRRVSCRRTSVTPTISSPGDSIFR